MLSSTSSLSAPATALRLLGAIDATEEKKQTGKPERASNVASFEFDSQGVAFASTGSMDAEAFLEGLEAVSDEWEFAQDNSRWTGADGNGVIDGKAFQKLTDAIVANRDRFPDGEFTIKLAWADGASIEKTIPPRAPPRVHSVSISAVFGAAASGHTAPVSTASVSEASAKALYGEWT